MANKKLEIKDKTFVFTGEMSMARETAKSKVIMLGGKVTSLPSGKTTYLVTGNEPGPKKIEKAKEIGIKILNEKEFLEMIKEKEQNFSDTIIIKDTNKNKETLTELWTEKWRPLKEEDFIGNQALIKSLKDYLTNPTNQKAVLLSGPPGCGKTTMAYFVAKQLKIQILEFNASDIRNKTEIVKHIKGGIGFLSISSNLKLEKKVLIMDEIDGMTSDRGGLAELTQLIKQSKIPIICICNDRQHPKIRTLTNYCIDLKFRKLESRQIIPRLKLILEKEKRKLPDNILNEIVNTANGDMRYIINTIQSLFLRETISSKSINLMKKNILKNIFELATEIFHKKSISEKLENYFEDYSLIPLFVQENYLKIDFKTKRDLYNCVESISFGDIIEKNIYGPNQMWNLAPIHGVFSSILPTTQGFLNKRIDFPGYLGQNSKQLKNKRNIKKVLQHVFKNIKCEASTFRLYYLNLLMKNYEKLFESEEIKGCLNFLVEYDLLKEDLEILFEIFPESQSVFKKTSTKFKAAYTKEYKKLVRDLPYTIDEEKSEEDEEE